MVDSYGAFTLDLQLGTALPLDDSQWDDLAACPPPAAASAQRLRDSPGRQPIYLRWLSRWPEWFDDAVDAWVAIDADALRGAVRTRSRVDSEPKAQPVAAPSPEPRPRAERRHDGRWPVWPVEYHERPQPNLALGLLLSAASAEPTVAARFDLRPLGSARPAAIADITAEPTGILLFSHYVWSTRGNLRISATAKAANPRLITVHGGPNAPGYEDDVRVFFARNPDVDIVVHGEGEATLAEVLARLGESGAPDSDDPDRLACLHGVAGLSYRSVAGEVVRGPKRTRVADLDHAPSPYLSGRFDELDLAGTLTVLETNRGCPFGCTFCDWGSATRSRVRMFDLDRVVAEIDWMADHDVEGIFVADANFGAFDRDLVIAKAIAEARKRTGSPRQVVFTFAKDTAELVIPLVDQLWEAGIEIDGNIALQTVDEPTLRVVRRKNLPQAEYERVRRQFRDRGLPLTSDIMLGLPGSTFESMRGDIQFCLDHEITPRAHRTVLLPNAPMSAPQHRAEHGLVTDRLQRTLSGRTFSAEDLAQIGNLHRLADAWDYYGIARLPLRFVAKDHGIAETTVLERIDELSRHDADQYPAIAWAAVGFTAWLVPPGTWKAFLTELGEWLVAELAIPDDAALRSILAAQEAMLPSPGASFPRRVELEHDVVAWMSRHHEDPAGRSLPNLDTYGPAILEVDDDGRNEHLLVANRQSRAHSGRPLREVRRIYAPSWELAHPLARPRMLDVEQHAFRFA